MCTHTHNSCYKALSKSTLVSHREDSRLPTQKRNVDSIQLFEPVLKRFQKALDQFMFPVSSCHSATALPNLGALRGLNISQFGGST